MMLRHPNVVQLYEVLESEEEVFLVMELCGGGTLYDQLEEHVASYPCFLGFVLVAGLIFFFVGDSPSPRTRHAITLHA